MQKILGLLVTSLLLASCFRVGFDSPEQEQEEERDEIGTQFSVPELELEEMSEAAARGIGSPPNEWDLRVAEPGALQPTSADWVVIRPGRFVMGSPVDEPCRRDNETKHEVVLTRSFEISRYEVTQGEFENLLGHNPSYFSACGQSCPVENVTWWEAAAYCNALSTEYGLAACYTCAGDGPGVACSVAEEFAEGRIYDCPGFRLPTDAEWEYAYRAGSDLPYHSGLNDPTECHNCGGDANLKPIGWYCNNSDQTPHPVGQKAPNEWGLFDMAGNVWEWCHDRFIMDLSEAPAVDPWGLPSGPDHVIRGGSYINAPGNLRAAARSIGGRSLRHKNHGFRCARTVTP
jgi:formylglycine-generating enzyme required for sulfatase activity